MRITEQISELVREYRSMNTGEGINLSRLMELRKDLACLSFELSIETAKAKRLYDQAYAGRKIREAREKIDSVSNGATNSLADSVSIWESRSERIDQAKAEADYSAGKIILTQVNEVLNSMQQEIAELRREYNEQ